MKPVSEHRKNQRGFALLLIFLMAAAIALMLYIQLPRVAFETEREKERLLIDRGEQYKRAIQLYYVAYQRYPTRIEDLENTNDKRYLRHRYVNPYTGKDEWRLIHVNGGVLTDSLVQKPPPAGGTPGGGGTLAGSTSSPTPPLTPVNNGADPNAPAAVNQAVLQRPSDRTLPSNSSFNQTATNYNPAAAATPFPNGVPGQQNGFQQNPPNYNDPATFPPMSLYPNGYNAPPTAQQPGFNQPGFNQPGFNQPGFNPGLNQPGLNQPGLNQPGLNLPGQPGFNQPGNQIGFNPPGIQPGINQPGLNQPGLNQPGLNQPGLNQPGLNQPGLNQPGLNQPGGIQGFPPQPIPGQQPPNQVTTGQFTPGGLPGGLQPPQGINPPGINPNFPNQFPDPNNPNGGQPAPPPFQPFPGGGGVPTTPGGGAPNQAINLINQLLTTPRQPPAGIGTITPQTTTGGAAGLAGVASTYTGPAIMSYGSRTEFEEWEFIFQPNAQQGVAGAGLQRPNTQPGQPGQPGLPGQPGQPGQSGNPSPIGFPPGFPPPGLPGSRP